ncbi:MAG: YbhN family protein [Methylophilaceae bacterium]
MLILNKHVANKRHWVVAGKIILAVTLIAILLSKGSLDFGSIRGVWSRLDLFIPALLCLFAGLLISGVRWWILLIISDHKIHLKTVLSLQLMGSFFSTWLPGASGGDAVRGIQIYRLLESGRSTALISIITDRVFALLGLVSIAAIVALFLPAQLTHSAALAAYISLIKIIAVCIVLSLVSGLVLIWLTLRFSLLEYIPVKIRSYLNTIVATTVIYRKKWPALAFCWLLSMLASGIVVIGIVFIAAIFPYAPNPLISAIAGVFGNVFSAIPATPGGLGVGESIFAKICADFSASVAPFATIYFTFRVGMLIANIPGMIVTLLYNHSKHQQMARSGQS